MCRTSESALSMLALMPRTEEERIDMEQDYQRRQTAVRNVTTGDLEAAEKRPRMPPLGWGNVLILFTTRALLLDMLFTEHNAHLQGLNSMRRFLTGLATSKQYYSAEFFANVVWICIDDAVRHFNQVMPHEDLQFSNGMEILQYLTTRLRKVAKLLQVQGEFRAPTLPREWNVHAQRWWMGGNYVPSVVTYPGTASIPGSGTAATSRTLSITGSYKQPGGAHQPRDRGAAGNNNRHKQFREEHPDRYGPMGVNPEVDNQIKNITKRIDDYDFPLLEMAAGNTWWSMHMCEEVDEGVCPAYATGKYLSPRCRARHLLGRETPRAWVSNFCKTTKQRFKRMSKGEDIQPRAKRPRQGSFK